MNTIGVRTPPQYDRILFRSQRIGFSINSDALTGIYIVDDMLPQPNWPSDHASHAAALLGTLNELSGFVTTPLSWATGVVLCVRASRDTPI